MFLLLPSILARHLDKIVIHDDGSRDSHQKWARLQAAWRQHPLGHRNVDLEVYTSTGTSVDARLVYPGRVTTRTAPSMPHPNERVQHIFEQVMSESTAQHVLFLSVDCLPIVDNWVDRVEELVVEPNAKFWVKASLMLHGEHSLGSADAFYHHLMSSALYHFAPDFQRQYHEMKAFAHRHYPAGPFSFVFHRYLYDSRAMERARFLFTRFVVDDFVFVARGRTLARPVEAIFQVDDS